MNRIVSPTLVESSVVKIIYKKENGTGFFITTDTIMTAYHIFLDSEIDEDSIFFHTNKGEIYNASILHIDIENDICLLKVTNENSSYLPLTETSIQINNNWNSFGFPYKEDNQGLRIFGTINQLVKNEKYDFTLNCSNIESYYDYSGLSGAPIMSSGRVIGVTLKQLDNKIGAISINKIADMLSKFQIKILKEEVLNEIPTQLKKDIENMVVNDQVVARLDCIIKNHSNWILLKGNPGTGKTTNVASYTPDEGCLILGKYFTKIPNDSKPKSLRISRENFLNWIEESISIELTGELPPKNAEPIDKRIESLSDDFENLGEYLERENKLGLFFIDGLDEVANLKEFLEIIPDTLSENLRFVLSCTSKNILPINIRNFINEDQTIVVAPLEIDLCEFYCENKFQGKVDFENIQKIASKSEGHPLYLNYLINYVLSSEISQDEEELRGWIEKIPSISGDIENYYNVIWEGIYKDSNKLWICLILSQLRQAVEEEDFVNILPKDIKRHYYSVIPKISHLIKNDRLEIYHNSFKDYILKKLPLYAKECHDIIVQFCENFPNEIYSIINLIYHNALSSNPDKAIVNCNQIWADNLAIYHVEPDLIIDDIKRVLDLSIQLKQTTQLIRLLLLLQRIDFRYNSVWLEYAFEMALALIAQEKYTDALKYLVRRNVLLIGISDATLFLQHFYENDAFDEAGILESAIEREYRKELHTGISSKEGVSASLFISKARTIILGSRKDFNNAQSEVCEYLNLFRVNPTSGATKIGFNDSPLLKYVIDHSSAWNNAYLLRYYDASLNLNEIIRDGIIKVDDSWTGIFATSLLIYTEELDGYNLADFNTEDNQKKLAASTEFLIENYGYVKSGQTRKIIILALLKVTTKPELLLSVIDDYLLESKDVELRAENGVDINMGNFTNLCLHNNCLGFKDGSVNFNIKAKQWNHRSWEKDLVDLVSEIYYFEGHAYFFKASEQLNSKEEYLKLTLRKIVNTINFNFDRRSYWDRSYQLPEKLMPEVLKKLIHLVYEFDFENLTVFLKTLEDNTIRQLGLYSEGFRESLCKIIHTLLLLKVENNLILAFVEIWEKHVLNGVQNRWERTSDLLKITEIYSLLNLQHESDRIFQEMLNTSMGPTWYKESQLMLINTVLENFKSAPENILTMYAAILDQASGEMTFQRYVRNCKEDFISSLVLNQHLQKGLDYYKFEVLPLPATLNYNAESSDFDAPRLGDGYCMGARNINDARGVLLILKTVNCNPYLKLGLCKIFAINDDTSRYISYYSEQIAQALNAVEILQDGNIDEACESIAELIGRDEMDSDCRREILCSLGENLSSVNILKLRDLLLKQSIRWAADYDPGTLAQDPPIKEKNIYDVFNESLLDENSFNKVEKIKEGLQIFKGDQRSIWFNNWSTSTDLAKKNIKKLFEDQETVIEYLRPNILNFDNEYWDICKELIGFLKGKLQDEQVIELYQIVSDHFNFIVRPTTDAQEKYKWISDNTEVKSVDELIADFIIWHLNHSNSEVRDNAMEVLEYLCKLTDFTVKCLFESCLSNIPVPSTELSSYILKNISKDSPAIIRDFLTQNANILQEIGNIKHLTIKKNLRDVSIELNKIGFTDLFNVINTSIPATLILTDEVFFENDSHLAYIYDILDDLNSNLLLNGQFCIQLNELIDNYCMPLTKEEVKKSDRYLRRSFPEDMIEGRYNEYVRHALNIAICNRVSHDNMDEIFNIINYVQ